MSTDKYRNRLITLLKELFQLDQPELDFGLYKIMHAKSVQISQFLENDLLKEIERAFGKADGDRIAQAKAAYDAAFEQAKKFGAPEPENTVGVKEAKAAYENAKDGGNAETEIYDHLYRFFERYYDNGDFMSRRYYGRESDNRAAPYAVPYDGREVYLHWANKDQYYIKSSEYLTNYTFDLNEAIRQETERQKSGQGKTGGLDFSSDTTTEPRKVHLRIVGASEGEHGNIKADNDQKRFFIIHAEEPVKLENDELVIQFQYRNDAEKSGQDKKWQQTRLDQAQEVIVAALKAMPEAGAFIQPLQLPAPTDAEKTRTLLGKHLQKYSNRNTMDYFIHKDLGGYLRRELDFYIKNEIMRLDDIENAEAPKVEQYLAKIKVLRRISHQLIAFLAQLENFQKKLWLKKKFVTETQYCITLDRIPESFYPEIAANEKQREEWVKLFAIDEITGDLATQAYSAPLTVDFLKANPCLLIDTALYAADLKSRLLNEMPALDSHCNGILINSENCQALNLASSVLRNKVNCLYVDPPYNTGGDDFSYKDNYQHSSWMSMFGERLTRFLPLSSSDSTLFSSIDDNESFSLKNILDEIVGSGAFESQIIVQSNKRGQTYQSIAKTHEYLFCYLLGENSEIFELPKDVPANSLNDSLGIYELWELRNRNPKFGKHNRPNLYFPIYLNPESCNEEGYAELSLIKTDHFNLEVFPKNSTGGESCWRWGKPKVSVALIKDLHSVLVGKQRRDGGWNIYEKARKSSTKAKSIWAETEVINEQGTVEAGSLGLSGFGFPKPPGLLKKILRIGSKSDGLVMDYFAGSGTTGHAVISLNREEGACRRYVLIEMGEYFDDVMKSRICKVAYSATWKNGKPVDRNTGISQFFKYIRLESYEDALNNLVVKQDENRDLSLRNHSDMQRDYLLNYFLDVETDGSQSLLNIDDFRDPTAYKMWIKKPGSDEQVLQTIDLIETFNWLLGLWVDHLASPQSFNGEFDRETDPDLPGDQNTRLICKRLRLEANGEYWFRLVEGYTLRVPGDDSTKVPTLIIWRKLTDDAEKDNAALQKYLETIGVSTREKTYEVIYVNGSHTLPNPVVEGEQTKVRLTEEAFHQAMWAEA